MAASALYDACAELLAAADSALALTIGGAIPRKFVSPGMPVFDCPPQLTVHSGGPSMADTAPLSPWLQPGHRVHIGSIVDLAVLTITVARCTPTLKETAHKITFPNPADLDASAQEILNDVWVIWNHLVTLKKNETLFPPLQREMFFGAAVALRTSGGVAGWEIPIRVQLPGYRTA